MRAIHTLSFLLIVAQTPILAAQSWTVPQPTVDPRGARSPVIMSDGGTALIGGRPPISWLLEGSYLDHRGGPLTDAYNDGYGAKVGFNSLITPWGMNGDLFWTGGFEYQQWNADNFNANSLLANFGPDGDADLYGGFVGIGLEESGPYRSYFGEFDLFVVLRATAGVGGMHQGFNQQPFDPTLPTFVLNEPTPESSSAYASGCFSTGIGINSGYSSLGFLISYQLLRSSIIVDERSDTDSIVYGLQGTIVLDGLYQRPTQPRLSRLPYVNRLFRNRGYGREAQTMQRMVTPRIIIQEEESE